MIRGLRGLSRRRRLILIAAVVLMLFLIHGFKSLFSSTDQTPIICNQNENVKREMRDIFFRGIASLRSMHLQPFLCYDSLWSVLDSQQEPFVWKSHNELCLRNEDVSGMEEAVVIRNFQRQGLRLSYFSSTGEYDVSESPSGAVRLKIVLFEKDVVTGNMRRVGWKHRLIPPDSCALIHCFPPNLLTPPLGRKQLYGIDVPVPREEIEIQKYHYPDDWWKSSRVPKECTSTDSQE